MQVNVCMCMYVCDAQCTRFIEFIVSAISTKWSAERKIVGLVNLASVITHTTSLSLSLSPSLSLSLSLSQVLYFHLPATILYAEVNNPHVTPVETPPTPKSMYRIDRQHDPKKMTPTEYILHHDTVFLVLDEQHHPPVIDAVTEVCVCVCVCVCVL